MSKSSLPDVSVEDHGSICLFRCNNDTVLQHLKDNTGEEAQWLGKALVVEPRYVQTCVETLQENGFTAQ